MLISVRLCAAGFAAILVSALCAEPAFAQRIRDRDPSRCRLPGEMKEIAAEIDRLAKAEKRDSDKLARLERVRETDNDRYQTLEQQPHASDDDKAKTEKAREVVKIDDLKIQDVRINLGFIKTELPFLRSLKPCPPPLQQAAPEPVKHYSVGTLVKPRRAIVEVVERGRPQRPVLEVVERAPAMSWTGFYVGGALGANWSSGNWATTDLRSLGTIDILSDAAKEKQATNLAEEVYFGYMWEGSPEWIAGFEADFAYYNALEDPGIPGTGGLPGNRASDSVTMGQKWSASLRGRIGHTITPSTIVYIAGGPSFMKMNATVNCTGPGVCGTNGIPAFSQTNSTTKVGWTLGGGVETKLWDNWRGRAEYRYADYGTFSTSFGTPAQLALAAGIKVHTNTLLLGLAYAFGGR
jgi:outer membrane immunogenic protein